MKAYRTGNMVVAPGRGIVVEVTDSGKRQVMQSLGLPSKNNSFLLPHTEEACRFLQNNGFHPEVAAPFMVSDKPLIEGKYKPMPHQAITSAFATYNPRAFILSEPRLGKTGSLILAAHYLQCQKMVTGAFLIITTVTTMPSVWARSILEAIPNAQVRIVHGPKREKELAKPAHFYITNYDSCRISERAFVEAVRDGRVGACIIDELTHVANVSSKRHRSIANITRPLKYVYGATGTPGNNPEAIYGMVRMIAPERVPKTKNAWLGMTTWQYGPEPFMRNLTEDAPQKFFNAMQPAIRFVKKDILSLPPITVQDREVPMTSEQRKVWERLRVDMRAVTESGAVLTAANAGVLLGKMLQLGVGFCYDQQGKPQSVNCDPRLKAILEIIAETERKVVVFGIYKWANRWYLDAIRKAGVTAELIDGEVTGVKRAKILDDFEKPDGFRVLIAHPTTTGIGTDLAASDTMILNGPPLLGGFIWGQTLERLSSIKQTSQNINIIRLISLPEERRVFRNLDKGHDEAAIIADLFAASSRSESHVDNSR